MNSEDLLQEQIRLEKEICWAHHRSPSDSALLARLRSARERVRDRIEVSIGLRKAFVGLDKIGVRSLQEQALAYPLLSSPDQVSVTSMSPALHLVENNSPSFLELGENEPMSSCPDLIPGLTRDLENAKTSEEKAKILHHIAGVFGSRGNKEKEFFFLKRALLKTPDNIEILKDLGSHYLNRGHVSLAIACAQRVVRLGGKAVLEFCEIAHYFLDRRNTDQARQYAVHAVGFSEKTAEECYSLGKILLRVEEYAKARQCLEPLLEMDYIPPPMLEEIRELLQHPLNQRSCLHLVRGPQS